MIRDTITKIEERLHGAPALSEESRRELLQLIAQLKQEVASVDEARARNITGATKDATEHWVKEPPNPELLKGSLADLKASVDGFEKSHPGLVQVVNRICTTLSNIGI